MDKKDKKDKRITRRKVVPSKVPKLPPEDLSGGRILEGTSECQRVRWREGQRHEFGSARKLSG